MVFFSSIITFLNILLLIPVFWRKQRQTVKLIYFQLKLSVLLRIYVDQAYSGFRGNTCVLVAF